jgi:hypothetical protein
MSKKLFHIAKMHVICKKINMKKILTLVAIIYCFAAKAQITKDSLLKVMTTEACEELNKKDLTKIDAKNLEAEMGMLLAPAMMGHLEDIERIYGGGMTDQDAMKKMGMDLGMRLATKCPKFMELSMQAMSNGTKPSASKIKVNEAPSNNEEASVSGTLLGVNAGDITTISVSESKGKTTKLYWLEYFDNADDLKTNSKKYLNKKVTISYMEKSVYDFVRKNYKTIKVITSIDLQ